MVLRVITKSFRLTLVEYEQFKKLRGWRNRYDWSEVIKGALSDASETKEREFHSPLALFKDLEEVSNTGTSQGSSTTVATPEAEQQFRLALDVHEKLAKAATAPATSPATSPAKTTKKKPSPATSPAKTTKKKPSPATSPAKTTKTVSNTRKEKGSNVNR